MYKDYEVVYESKLNEYLIFWIIFGIIVLILLIVVLFSISKVLKKAGRSPIAGLIPIYNLIPLLEITNIGKKYFVPLIIPIVNIPFWLVLNIELAKFFKKSKRFGIGLSILPFIFYPILAFNNSEYIGINLVAMNNNSTDIIPMIDDEKNTLIEKDINDEVDISINTSSISLGGGKYQKEYQNSLLSVEDNIIAKGEVKKTKSNELITNGKFFNGNIIDKKQENTTPNITTTTTTTNNNNNNNNSLFNVSYIDTPKNQNNIEPSVNTKQQINNMNINLNNSQNINNPQQNQISNNPQVDLLKSNNPSLQNGPKLCPNCGTRVADNSKICMICGQKLL